MNTAENPEETDFATMFEIPRRAAAAMLQRVIELLWPRVLPRMPMRKYCPGVQSCAVRRRLLRTLWNRQQLDEGNVAERE